MAAGLREGNESLFEKAFLHHFNRSANYLIEKDGATADQARGATMDALLSFRRGIIAGKIHYGNLNYLLTRMARQHYYKSVKKDLPGQASDDQLEGLISPNAEIDPDTMKVLSAAWESLSQSCRRLLHQFFYQERSLAETAAKAGRTPEAVRKQKQRCVAKLRASFITIS